jgi:Na+/H+-dicarboxylate symporter
MGEGERPALLLAVEVIPDIFRTIGNVTADLAATRIIADDDTPETDPAAGI